LDKSLKKIDHIVSEAAVLENLYFQWHSILNVNKFDVVVYFS